MALKTKSPIRVATAAATTTAATTAAMTEAAADHVSRLVIQRPKFPDVGMRGLSVRLPHGGLPEIVSPHLMSLIERTGGPSGPIGLQFIAQPEKEQRSSKKIMDPLMDPLNEDHHEVAPGLVYKYKGKMKKSGEIIYHGRVLWTITRFCGSYCRFCTRGREVGTAPNGRVCTKAAIANKTLLSDQDIQTVFNFLKKHKEINEVILSGGDPLTTPQDYFTKIIDGLAALQAEGYLDIIRVGTRLPIHNPIMIKDWHYEVLSKIKNPYLMLHVNHPLELTPETLVVLNNFRRITMGFVLSQTVLLKNVNDSVQVLHDLFVRMTKEGIRPYYLYQNDPVYWAKHFTVPIKKGMKIWGQLRPILSGIAATVRFSVDVPFGYGKIPIPEGNAWDFNSKEFTDFKGVKHKLF